MTDGVTVFDACALIALQRNEPGADQAVLWLTQPATPVMMHAINVCEVLYDALRRDPSMALAELLHDLGQLGITVADAFPEALLERAACLKAYWRRISLADCIALALAEEQAGVLVTTDHHEFDPLAAAGHPIRFLR